MPLPLTTRDSNCVARCLVWSVPLGSSQLFTFVQHRCARTGREMLHYLLKVLVCDCLLTCFADLLQHPCSSTQFAFLPINFVSLLTLLMCVCHRSLWFSTCWPFPLEFPPSSSQIYRLLHCLQIQSKNSPFLWCKHLWPLAIYIRALLISILKLYFVMLLEFL